MTAFEVRSEMRKAYWIRREIKARVRRMEELRSMAEKITPTFSPTPGGGGDGSRVENYAVLIIEMTQDLEERTAELLEVEKKIQGWIDYISDPRARAIAIDYHLNGLNVEEVGAVNGYERRQVFRLLSEAYEEIAEKLNHVTKCH